MSEETFQELTETQRQEALAMLVLSGSRETASEYAGCTVQAILTHEKYDFDFAEKVRKSRMKPEIQILNNLMNAGRDPKQWRASLVALELINPEKYAFRRRNDLCKSDIKFFVTQIVEVLKTELKMQIARKVIRSINKIMSAVIIPQKGIFYVPEPTTIDATCANDESKVVGGSEENGSESTMPQEK